MDDVARSDDLVRRYVTPGLDRVERGQPLSIATPHR